MLVATLAFAWFDPDGSLEPWDVWHSHQFQDWADWRYWVIGAALDFAALALLVLVMVALCCTCTALRIACWECTYTIPKAVVNWWYGMTARFTGYNPTYSEQASTWIGRLESSSVVGGTEMNMYP